MKLKDKIILGIIMGLLIIFLPKILNSKIYLLIISIIIISKIILFKNFKNKKILWKRTKKYIKKTWLMCIGDVLLTAIWVQKTSINNETNMVVRFFFNIFGYFGLLFTLVLALFLFYLVYSTTYITEKMSGVKLIFYCISILYIFIYILHFITLSRIYGGFL